MLQNNGVQNWLNKLGESYSQIKFGPGVVGKTSYGMVGIILLWVVILFRLSSDLLMNGSLFLGGIIATLVYRWWVSKSHDFAEKHPDLALLEGAQLIEYRKFETQAKGLAALPASLPVIDPNAPKLIEPISQEPDK